MAVHMRSFNCYWYTTPSFVMKLPMSFHPCFLCMYYLIYYQQGRYCCIVGQEEWCARLVASTARMPEDHFLARLPEGEPSRRLLWHPPQARPSLLVGKVLTGCYTYPIGIHVLFCRRDYLGVSVTDKNQCFGSE